MLNRIAIIGPGLLGGSVCKAVRQIFPQVSIAAYGRSIEKLSKILEDKCADTVDSIDAVDFSGLDLIVVATPVKTSIPIIKNLLSDKRLEPQTLIIDVGSVKNKILNSVAGLERVPQFIGCHPMAGSQNDGYSYSRHDLYQNTTVIITPHQKNIDRDVSIITEFWQKLGAATVTVAADIHDQYIAFTSHMPHFAACSIAGALQKFEELNKNKERVSHFIGNGYRDATRISSGSPVMWSEIAELNSDNIIKALNDIITELSCVRDLLVNSNSEPLNLQNYLQKIKDYRDGIE